MDERPEAPTEDAWRAFGSGLADAIFAVDGFVEVGPAGGDVGLVAQAARDDDALLLTVEGLERDAYAPFVAIGWDEPDRTEPTAHQHVARSECDRAADLMVRTLREVLAVLHPSLVEHNPPHGDVPVDIVDRARPPRPETDSDAGSGPPREVRPSPMPVAIFPEGWKGSVLLVRAALRGLGDDQRWHPVGEGTFRVSTVHGTVDLEVPRYRPEVRIVSSLVREVLADDVALFETNALNRAHPSVQFLYRQGEVLLRRTVATEPFVGRHLLEVVRHTVRIVDGVVPELERRLGGSVAHAVNARWPGTAPHVRGGITPEMRALLEMETQAPGSVDAELVAQHFELDFQRMLTAVDVYTALLATWDLEVQRLGPAAVLDVAELQHRQREAARQIELLRAAVAIAVEVRVGRRVSRGSRGAPAEPGS